MNESILISEWVRLALYILMAVLPVWIDFFTKSTDYSFRGLMMPILTSLNAAVVVALAKTAMRRPAPNAPPTPVEITNAPANPVPVTETRT